MNVTNNDLGKYSAFTPGNCATVPARAMVGGSRKQNQRGGSEAYGLQSYTAGYDMNRPVEAGGGSAHYMDWTVYDKTCKGGARKGSKSHKKNRKSRS